MCECAINLKVINSPENKRVFAELYKLAKSMANVIEQSVIERDKAASNSDAVNSESVNRPVKSRQSKVVHRLQNARKRRFFK